MNLKPPTGDTHNPERRTFHSSDLEGWSRPSPSLGVLGHPVGHSISPAMHNAALARMAETNSALREWRYFKFDIPPDELSRALTLLHRAGFLGINLTIPHKTRVRSLLSNVDPAAMRMGAVNTLLRTEEGYQGFNSDGYGLAAAIFEQFGVRLSSAPVILLGAGGAARAAAVQCLIDECPELWIGNRNPERLSDLVGELRAEKHNTRLETFDLRSPENNLPDEGLIVNATSLGLSPDDPPPVDLSSLSGRYCVYDMIYNPAETALLKEASRLGMPAANGLSMLVHQGVRSLEIWTGASAPAETMHRAALSALDQ